MGMRYVPEEKLAPPLTYVKCQNTTCEIPVRNPYLNVYCSQKCNRGHKKTLSKFRS